MSSSYARQQRRRKSLQTDRRVLLRRPVEIDPAKSPPTVAREWWEGYKRERGRRAKTRPIVRLTEHEVDWGAEPGPGDEIGFGMHPYDLDDCLRAAVATATQAPIEQVPDLALADRLKRGEGRDEICRSSWQTIDRWADRRGLTMMFWDGTELPAPRERWIGVVVDEIGVHAHPNQTALSPSGRAVRLPPRIGGGFGDHCLVMSHTRLVFDPSWSVKTPPGLKPLRCKPSQIKYGITFDRKDTH